MSDSDRGKRNPTIGQIFAVLSGFLLVALVVGVVAFSQGAERERRYQTPANYAKSAKVEAQSQCVGREPSRAFECVYEIVQASQDQARAEQDLDAQQGMKFWALVMGLLTTATVVATFIGIGLLKGTLDATAAMLEEAKDLTQETIKATNAMLEANRIASNAQRPWLQIDVRPSGPLICENGKIRGQFAISAKCIGQTPAVNVLISGVMDSQSGQMFLMGLGIRPLRERLQSMAAKKTPIANEIFPNDELTMHQYSFGMEEIKTMRGKVYPTVAVGAIYQWPGGIGETLMSYQLLRRDRQDFGPPDGRWEVPAEQIEIRRDGTHSIA